MSAPVDSPSLGSAESQIVSLPRVVVPLPIERPSAETIREQNALAAPLFSEVKWPSGGAPRPVGFYSAGCLAGAEQLALQGPHWQVM
ncbi:MAG TPA: penicillin-insensitive murein endopeptidase, partial [Acidobacteriaceae bacterium]|nr:penicillin-insensitive murein endopeptidase [Acidobacteriaceae bacterium]